MSSNTDKVKTALESIETGLAAINTNESWIRYLQFCSNFYHYSYSNIILIMTQCPNATYVAGYNTWRKMNRQVRKNERGIGILCPIFRKVEIFKEPDDKSVYNDEDGKKEVRKVISGFKIGYVFDLSQTDGDDLLLPVLVRGLAGNSEEEKQLYESLFKYASTKCTVQEVANISAKASYNIDTQVIQVRSNLEYRQKIKSLIHELCHFVDFKINPDLKIARNIREISAESSCYVICLRLGIDVSEYSFGYIQSWITDSKDIGEVADSVQKIVSIILNELAESSDFAFSDLVEE